MLDAFANYLADSVKAHPVLTAMLLSLELLSIVEKVCKRIVIFKHRMVLLWRKFRAEPDERLLLD